MSDEHDAPAPPPPSTQTQTRTAVAEETRSKQPVPWNVVLLDDDHHTYEYVMAMMMQLFAMDEVQAYKIACTVDKDKRAVCLTTHKERAEFKRDQILAFGRDPMMSSSVGSMSSIIEPAEFDGDDNKDGLDRGGA
ncbi:MAG: ATP-dependent Clp protease adaptor ClpS [Planctomycetes bacterium]|nr:ATP-dependent Clp protease adaptor ClpS [Planctomycetota bacterium]